MGWASAIDLTELFTSYDREGWVEELTEALSQCGPLPDIPAFLEAGWVCQEKVYCQQQILRKANRFMGHLQVAIRKLPRLKSLILRICCSSTVLGSSMIEPHFRLHYNQCESLDHDNPIIAQRMLQAACKGILDSTSDVGIFHAENFASMLFNLDGQDLTPLHDFFDRVRTLSFSLKAKFGRSVGGLMIRLLPRSTPHLHDLTIEYRESRDLIRIAIDSVVSECTWPALEHLRLSRVLVYRRHWLRFLGRHTHCLKHLKLSDLSLHNERPSVDRESLIKQMALVIDLESLDFEWTGVL